MSPPAVLFGGPSPEHDISILTGLQAARALGDAVCLYWSKQGEWFDVDPGLEGSDFAGGAPAKARPLRFVAGAGGGWVGEGGALRRERPLELSAVVNCCHGGPGEDGSLQGALDLAGIAYTGPSAAGAALGMDKYAFGAVAAAAGLAVLPRVLAGITDGWKPPFDGPYIVKPRFGGSSIGIAVVDDAAAVVAAVRNSAHLRGGAVVEPFLASAADLNVAVRLWPEPQQSAIVRPERASGGIYSYAEKYVPGEGMASAPQEVNPALPVGAAEAVRAAVAALCDVALVRGVPRVDFLLDGEQLYLNEINTIPGSLAKHLWADPVVPFEHLLRDLLGEASARPTTGHWTTQGADGLALRSAASIASKLG